MVPRFRCSVAVAMACALLCALPCATTAPANWAAASALLAESMQKISDRWEVDDFPVFLKAAWMPDPSYERMKHKLKLKLMGSALGVRQSFVVSFTGSSVTAGHDSPFVKSYPVLVNSALQPVFDAMNVDLVVRNVAMGNNPCKPYDICVRTFAGDNADVVVWEQAYNCHPSDKGYLFEQFIRQALLSPSEPIIAFSDSSTPNWNVKQCINVSSAPLRHTTELASALKDKGQGNERHIYSTVNKGNERHWGRLILDLMGRYPTAGVQTFLHSGYDHFRCKGPYVPAWKGKNVMWHPSLLGHELRAAHFSYVWLSILRDAASEVAATLQGTPSEEKLDGMMQDLCRGGGSKQCPTPAGSAPAARSQWFSATLPAPVHKNFNITDGVQCFTDYRPRAENTSDGSTSLKGLAVSDNILPPERKGKMPFVPGWTSITFEYIYMPHLVTKTSAAGYLDFKDILYGNNYSRPLDLLIHAKRAGKLYLCDVPSVPTKLHSAFHAGLGTSGLQLYLSSDTSSNAFIEDAAKPLKYFDNPRQSDDRCIQTEDAIAAGEYVLRISPVGLKYVILGTLLVP